MPFLSVIIPAYNVAQFLPRALDSLLGQTESDFELIVVNDGSTDKTGAICDQYAAQDVRVRVVHQTNEGAHAARNAGIALATGTYLYFMDGDDWAEPDMLAAMRAVAEKTNADLIVFGFYIDTYHGKGKPTRERKTLSDAFYPDATSFRRAAAALFDQNLLYPPWNKLYKTSRVRAENILFRKTKWDDFPFNWEYVRDVQTVAVDARAFYHFIRGLRLSETSGYFSGMREKREEEHAALVELYTHWGLSNDPSAREFLARRYVERTFGVLENIACKNSPLSAREKRMEMKDVIQSRAVRKGLAYAKPHSMHMKIMLKTIAAGYTWPTYCLARTISFVKAHGTWVFTYLKAHR